MSGEGQSGSILLSWPMLTLNHASVFDGGGEKDHSFLWTDLHKSGYTLSPIGHVLSY